MNRTITVAEILEAKGEALGLELLTPQVPLDGVVANADVSTPGLALAGFTERFPEGRMQVFGETEMTFLERLDEDQARSKLAGVLNLSVPAVFVSKGQSVPEYFIEIATHAGVPTFRSGLTTGDFFQLIKPYMEDALAPTTTLHGSLADIYGVGVLFRGESGIGKSECVLDLVERGHRLVADDLVIVSRHSSDVLMGRGHELQGFHMEIRGIGIIDVASMFGTRATRQQKRVEVVVDLETWDDTKAYNRTGLQKSTVEFLGVELPLVTIPLNPGKNLTVISEVIAMNQLLAYAGVNVAEKFHAGLQETVRRSRDYLVEDYE